MVHDFFFFALPQLFCNHGGKFSKFFLCHNIVVFSDTAWCRLGESNPLMSYVPTEIIRNIWLCKMVRVMRFVHAAYPINDLSPACAGRIAAACTLKTWAYNLHDWGICPKTLKNSVCLPIIVVAKLFLYILESVHHIASSVACRF